MLLARARVILLAVAAMVAAAWVLSELAPRRYAATARVLEGGTMVKFEDTGTDPTTALAAVNSRVRAHRGAEGSVVIDQAMVYPMPRNTAANLALGAAAGLALGIGLVLWRERRKPLGSRPVRSERDLLGALGEPLLAARPMSTAAVRALARQLQSHWFTPERALLPVVSAHTGEGRSWLAAALGAAFAELGEKTLLIDADFRSPGLHRLFGVPNRDGLSEFLHRDRKFSACAAHPNLSLIVAGTAGADPLELLARERLRALLAASARKFPVIIIDTPAAERGPDLEMFAALAGGALVVARQDSADPGALSRLQERLARCSASVVATVLNSAR
jgi:Mrp family chromosome partitioning ATPase